MKPKIKGSHNSSLRSKRPFAVVGRRVEITRIPDAPPHIGLEIPEGGIELPSRSPSKATSKASSQRAKMTDIPLVPGFSTAKVLRCVRYAGFYDIGRRIAAFYSIVNPINPTTEELGESLPPSSEEETLVPLANEDSLENNQFLTCGSKMIANLTPTGTNLGTTVLMQLAQDPRCHFQTFLSALAVLELSQTIRLGRQGANTVMVAYLASFRFI